MTLHWLLLRASSLPDGDDWLGSEERTVLAGLRFPKRRSEWRLGRFVAKQALASMAGIDRLDRIEIIAAKDGAPEAFIDGQRIDWAISISHREDVAACVIGSGTNVGCDLEAVEPRTARFVDDFFTERERSSVGGTTGVLHDRHVALTWSAKESALKVLRVGLRRDTRAVEVDIEESAATGKDWCPLTATVSPEGRRLRGWWRHEGDIVLTVIGDDLGSQMPLRLSPDQLKRRSS